MISFRKKLANQKEASMPLKKGESKTVVSSNIKEMMHAGRPKAQAVAAALSTARKGKGKKMGKGGCCGSKSKGH